VALDPFKTITKEERHTLILGAISKTPMSIGQILEKIPHIKRPTLKKDLQILVESSQLQTSGQGRGMLYFQKKP
jgi:DNA-binding HxlR family transcriptional regulator